MMNNFTASNVINCFNESKPRYAWVISQENHSLHNLKDAEGRYLTSLGISVNNIEELRLLGIEILRIDEEDRFDFCVINADQSLTVLGSVEPGE